MLLIHCFGDDLYGCLEAFALLLARARTDRPKKTGFFVPGHQPERSENPAVLQVRFKSTDIGVSRRAEPRRAAGSVRAPRCRRSSSPGLTRSQRIIFPFTEEALITSVGNQRLQ